MNVRASVLVLVVVLGVCLWAARTGHSQSEPDAVSLPLRLYLKVEGQETMIQGYEWGIASANKYEPFRITRRIGSSSPKLILACTTGEHFKKVEVIAREGSNEVVHWTLDDVTVVAYSTTGSGSVLEETIQFQVPTVDVNCGGAVATMTTKPKKK